MTKHTLGWHIKRIEIMLENQQRTQYWDLYGPGEYGDKQFEIYLKQVNKEAEKK